MLIQILALAITACLPILAQNQGPPRVTGRDLSIRCSVDTENRTVTAMLTNRSDHRVNVPFTSAGADYSVDLRTPAGARMPRTEAGELELAQLSDAELIKKGIHMRPGGSRRHFELNLQEERTETVALRDL